MNDALFEVQRRTLDDGGEEVQFRHQSSMGGAEKTFRFRPSGLVEVDIQRAGVSFWSVVFGPGVGNPSVEDLENRFLQRLAGYQRGGDSEKLLPGKQREDVFVPSSGLRLATLEDNYFLSALMPKEGVREVLIQPVRQRASVGDDEARFVSLDEMSAADEDTADEQWLLARSAEARMRFDTFMGSKRYGDLTALPYELESTVRWGFFGFLARPLYYGLNWIYQRVPNYGWAIVLMTIVIRLVFFPLTHKSQKSMAKMQEINPQVQALRKRYRPKLKDKQGRPNPDAQRQMNEEMMGLYKKAGVNPASGCLPILLQIPVFFAFFKLLSTSVELRNAPWIGWVKDLSVPDPIWLLPIGMLVTSVVVQRMSPPPPDPMQKRLMQIFPVMFAGFSITFPAGLVLYWVTNNFLTMGQQAFYQRSKKKEASSAAKKDTRS